jgi:hypothetical protein
MNDRETIREQLGLLQERHREWIQARRDSSTRQSTAP